MSKVQANLHIPSVEVQNVFADPSTGACDPLERPSVLPGLRFQASAPHDHRGGPPVPQAAAPVPHLQRGRALAPGVQQAGHPKDEGPSGRAARPAQDQGDMPRLCAGMNLDCDSSVCNRLCSSNAFFAVDMSIDFSCILILPAFLSASELLFIHPARSMLLMILLLPSQYQLS